MSTQATLDGDAIGAGGGRASSPADAERVTPFGAVYRDGSGDRRFALHRCPACNAAVNPHRWPGERTVPGVAEHIREHHNSLADFGAVDLHDDQRKLPLAAEVLRQ